MVPENLVTKIEQNQQARRDKNKKEGFVIAKKTECNARVMNKRQVKDTGDNGNRFLLRQIGKSQKLGELVGENNEKRQRGEED